MKILITGATGFIGSHLLQALSAAGHQVVAAVRDVRDARQRWPDCDAVAVDYCHDHDPEDWLPRLQGVEVVINAVGIINEHRRQTFGALHRDAPSALFRACAQSGVQRVIQISALGAEDTAFSQYHLTKRAADQCLMALPLNWTILMPSMVYGPGAKSMALFKALAALPVVPLIAKGDQAVQPVHVDDLCRAVLHIVVTNTPNRTRVSLVGPKPIIMKDLYAALRHWLGLDKAYFLSAPYWWVLLMARLGGALGDTPLTVDAVKMLRAGNTGDVAEVQRHFGFVPMDLPDALTRTPAQQADRWYAGLYFAPPLLRLSIALVWLTAGVVSAFVFPVTQSYALLAQAGITAAWAPLLLYGASLLDVGLGLATLLAYRLPWVGALQIVVILCYTVIISVSQPDYWLHPFGPVVKNLPLVMATLVMMVLARR